MTVVFAQSALVHPPGASGGGGGGAWLTITEAAQRLGRDAGHVRRTCKDKWSRAGLARQGQDDQWLVHVKAHARLRRSAGITTGDDAEFRGLPHEVRTKAIQRAQCVAALREARQQPGPLNQREAGLIAELQRRFPALSISRRSLYRWNADAGDPIDPMEMVDARKLTRTDGGGQLPGASVSPQCIDYFREIYLDGRQPSVRVCHERTVDFAARHGHAWCSSYHAAKRLKNKIIDRQTELQHRDPAIYRSTCQPYIERDPESFLANECWVSDHRPLDILCWVDDPKASDGRRTFRPYLTVWVDWRTRYVLGWTLVETPDTASILAALKMALLNPVVAGPPRYAWIDNGKDFDSYTLQGVTKVQRRRAASGKEMLLEGEQTIFPGVFGLLHIEPHHAIPFRGQGKARCERLFATVGARFDKSFPTYTGKDTTRKPEELKLHIAAGRAPHFDDVRDRLTDWLTGHNQAVSEIADLADDTRGKMSREDAYTTWTTPAIMPDAQTLAMVCYRWPAPPSGQLGRKVGRNGLTVTIGGTSVRFGAHDDRLREHKGTDRQVVVSYNPEDIDQLYVFDEQMSLVTIAQRNAAVGRYRDPISEQQLKAATRERAAYENARKVRRQFKEHEYLSTEEIAAAKAREQAQPTTIERQADGATRLVQTRLDQAAKRARNTKRVKTAGGGEVEVENIPFVYTSLRGNTADGDDATTTGFTFTAERDQEDAR